MLEEGDRSWVKNSGNGFVSVGRVLGPRITASEFQNDDIPALEKFEDGCLRNLANDQLLKGRRCGGAICLVRLTTGNPTFVF